MTPSIFCIKDLNNKHFAFVSQNQHKVNVMLVSYELFTLSLVTRIFLVAWGWVGEWKQHNLL